MRSHYRSVNLVELGISIVVMPRIVGWTLSLVSSGRCIIVAATLICNSTQRDINSLERN